MIILDASVALKWYFPETNSDAALDMLIKHAAEIAVPELFVVEVASALVRKANMDKAQSNGVRALLSDFQNKVVDGVFRIIHLPQNQPLGAAGLAIDLGHPLKDCIYLALAMELGCNLVTCDERFAKKAKRIWPGVQILESDGSDGRRPSNDADDDA